MQFVKETRAGMVREVPGVEEFAAMHHVIILQAIIPRASILDSVPLCLGGSFDVRHFFPPVIGTNRTGNTARRCTFPPFFSNKYNS
jgi:hypothetical protein